VASIQSCGLTLANGKVEKRHRAFYRDSAGAAIAVPQLHHGSDRATWPVGKAALMTGRDVCIGFEDTLRFPDGRLAATNGELAPEVVRMSVALGRDPSGSTRS
jgi:hypothetical protein